MSIQRNSLLLAAPLALSLSLAGCQPKADNSNQEALELLASKLDTLSAQVARLDKPAQPQRAARPKVGQLYKVPVHSTDAFRGSRDAKVTIVEATEFACPYCAKLASVTDKLLESYSGKSLKIVSKQFVVHPKTATLPALASCAANLQGKYPEFQSALWNRAWHSQGAMRLDGQALKQEALDTIASTLNLDLERLHKDMQTTCPQQVRANREQLSKLGVSGTPALYINGVYYGGPRTFDGLKQAVDQELGKVDAALAGGATLEGYYASVVAKGKATL